MSSGVPLLDFGTGPLLPPVVVRFRAPQRGVDARSSAGLSNTNGSVGKKRGDLSIGVMIGHKRMLRGARPERFSMTLDFGTQRRGGRRRLR